MRGWPTVSLSWLFALAPVSRSPVALGPGSCWLSPDLMLLVPPMERGSGSQRGAEVSPLQQCRALWGIPLGCSGATGGPWGAHYGGDGPSPVPSWHHSSFSSYHADGFCRADAPWEGFLVCSETLCTFPFSSKGIAGLVSSFPRSTHLLPGSSHLLPGSAHLWSAAFTEFPVGT